MLLLLESERSHLVLSLKEVCLLIYLKKGFLLLSSVFKEKVFSLNLDFFFLCAGQRCEFISLFLNSVVSHLHVDFHQ